LYLSDGPTIGPDRSARISLLALLWWVGLAALVVLGLVRSRGSVRRAATLATVGGVAFALEYVVFVSGFAPRFLLPALALLAVVAGVGLAGLSRLRPGKVVAAAALGLVLVWAGFQIDAAQRIERATLIDRARLRLVGLELRDLAGGRPCTFTSADGFPQLQLASGCLGHPLRRVPGPGSAPGVQFLIVPRSASVPSGWRSVRTTTGSGGRALTIYEVAG
jgi:hypothetical protein